VGKKTHFTIPHWSSSLEFGISGHHRPGQLPHAVSQDTDLSFYVPNSTYCCTLWSQSTNDTDRRTYTWTDGYYGYSI